MDVPVTAPPKNEGWEIERKFLVEALPSDLDTFSHESIRQGYLAMLADGSSVRIRQKGGRYFQTIKQGSGLQRAEVEVALTQDQFDTLWPLTEGRRLEKTRYQIPHGTHTVELDVYHGRLAPLVIAEVEFAAKEESAAYVPPDWFGDEVTEDDRFTNLSLAQYGAPFPQ